MEKRAAMKQVYIAYGSNMNLEQMEFRCPGAWVIGSSVLEGWRLVFQGYPGNAHANIIPDKKAKTPVLVWSIDEQDEATLDRYEGVAGGYYRKEYIPVTVSGITFERALVYLMSPNPFNLPTGRYFTGIQAGYREAGIKINPLQDALAYSAARIGKKV